MAAKYILCCSNAKKANVKRRIVHEDRQRFGKAKTAEMMEYFFETYDLFSPVPGSETLSIDNTTVSPDDAAKQIIERFGLAKPEPVTDSS